MGEKYTRELLEPIVSDSVSIAQVLRTLGLKEAGGTHTYISNKIKKLGIDTSHIKGQAWNNGGKNKRKRPPNDILKLKKSGKRERVTLLRRALIEVEVPYKCNKCELKDIWNQEELVLEIDHIDGNWLDNRKKNLQFLCPNCHSQKDHMIKVRKAPPTCPDCGGKKHKQSIRCKNCDNKFRIESNK